MYTLVSAPVLGFDLIRRTGGPEAATVLLTALALGPQDLAAMGAMHSEDDERAAAWVALGQESDDGAYSSLSQTLATLNLQGNGAVTARRRLEGSAIGTLGALVRFVRNEVFDWTWRRSADSGLSVQASDATAAASVTCDAVAASYAQHLISAAAKERLEGPWNAVAARLEPRPLDLGPQAATIHALLDAVRRLDAAQLAALRSPVGRAEGGLGGAGSVGSWAALVHEASWAAHLSGRTRTAAAAQLLTVQALAGAGVTVADAAAGAWNTVSGAVHGLVVADLLADADLAALTARVDALAGT